MPLETFAWNNGVVFSAPHATVVAAVDPSWNLLDGFAEPGAVFGYVFDGENAVLRRQGGPCSLPSGSFFVVNTASAELCSPGGRILLIHQPRADFPFQVGAVERMGRLRYIDGCTDSLLVPPWRRGEACLNYLHIPAGIEQTMHTHPSDRIGVVIRGRGQCVTPDGITELAPGVLELLRLSILEDRWTQPIVVLPDNTIVDGFHRWTVSADPAIRAMTDGLVPVVTLAADPAHRMMSTIRHNRARGTHAVLRMAEIVRTLVKAGMSHTEVCRRLGMEDEELERLLDRAGMTVRGTGGATSFGRAWAPSRNP